ncbi:mitochondrial ribonuclease P catalytic subunit isoform X2 [Nomia melanderi]|uniref:mitochondrial ribonuclease P catalytic subunit isoform X2 n=1 Tax=Nomia melanderi TaxID=2448451 RepID=UPI003FCD9732
MSFPKRIMVLHLSQTRSYMQNLITQILKPKKKIRRANNLDYVVKLTGEKFKCELTGPNVSTKTWETIKEHMIQDASVNPIIVDTYILNLCRRKELFYAGKTYYYNLLKVNNPSVVTTAEYLHLLGSKETPLTPAEKRIVWRTYNKISKNHSTFNDNLATACVMALVKADYIKESIKIIDDYEEFNPQEFLCAAVRPKAYVYNAYLEYCDQNPKSFTKHIQELFLLLKEYGIFPPECIMTRYIEVCNKHDWSAQTTRLINSECSRCRHKALNTALTDIEFKLLQQTVMSKLFVDKVYEISSPQELNRFLYFLEETKPYDVVIDGLNLLYSNNIKNLRSDNLVLLLKHLHKINKKALVIGRNHMERLNVVKQLQETTNFYFLKNTSQDDQFILYATIVSGNQAMIISNDYMREHKFALKNAKLNILFRRWQHSHQYIFNIDAAGQVRLQLLSGSYRDPEHRINSGVEKSGDFWHLPFQKHWHVTKISLQAPKQWACFRLPDSCGHFKQ